MRTSPPFPFRSYSARAAFVLVLSTVGNWSALVGGATTMKSKGCISFRRVWVMVARAALVAV